MPSIRSIALLLCLCSTSGCYFYFHPPTNRAHPKVIPGAEIELKSKEKTRSTRCSDRDTREICATGTDTYSFTEYTATYEGRKLTEGELLALVSPQYNAAWDRIESKKGQCRMSLVPTVLSGIALAAGGALSIYGSQKYGKIDQWDSKTRNATYAAVGATVGFGALSYAMGGFACVTAYRIGLGLETKYHHNHEFHVGARNFHWNERRIEELGTLVKAFNAKVRTGGATVTAKPTDETPTDETPPKPPTNDDFAPGSSSIMKTLADAELTQFSALLVETGIDRQLATGGPYTVVALDNKALTKVKTKLAKLDKAERLQTFRDLIFVGVVTSGERSLETLSGKASTLELRKNGTLKVRGKSGSMRLVGNATNGVVYVVD